MKIKKLELAGFKSFVDRTILRFDHDVLAIVGPNGCGKSNVVDAIRWCMGEQSARHLRGRSMEDVIFNGSESRLPHDLAEVTLTFENDVPEEMPLEYRAYAEIAVTRRLYRTGESEYLVNKTPVRLRDVTDLFLGTGAGTKAYSIVEQGKVGLIVSAKPEDRRLLIEEAAGITKFKSRKKQAEKKMELTQQNLLRVGDIINEIERNIVSLRRQAAKAERFVTYRSELEDLQLHEAAHRYLELVGWTKLEGSTCRTLSVALEQAKSDLGDCEAGIEDVRREVESAASDVERAQASSFSADNAVRGEGATIERISDRIASLTQRANQAAAERADMAEQAGRLAAESETVARSVAGLEAEERLQSNGLAGEEATLSRSVEAHSAAEDRLGKIRLEIGSVRAQIAGAEAALVACERRRTELGSRVDRLRSERDASEASRLSHESCAREIEEDVRRLQAECRKASERLSRLEQQLLIDKDSVRLREKDLERVQAELSNKKSRHGALEEVRARLDGVGAGTKALLRTNDSCLAGLLSDHIDASPEMVPALAGLLGAHLEDVVVRDIDRGVALLEQLAAQRQGRAAIVPLHGRFVAAAAPRWSNVAGRDPDSSGIVARLADVVRFAPEDEALVLSVVGDALVVRDVDCARRLRADGVEASLVTLDGSVVRADGRIEGGQGDVVAAAVLIGQREMRDLAAQIEELQSSASKRLEELQDARAALARTSSAVDEARRIAHESDLAVLRSEKDRQKASGQLELVARRLEALAAEEAELSLAMLSTESEREQSSMVLVEGQSRVDGAVAELAEAQSALDSARSAVDLARQVVTSSKVTIAATREKLTGLRAAATRLAVSAKELDERATRLVAEMDQTANVLRDAGRDLESHTAALAQARQGARDAAQELARLRDHFDSARARLVAHEASLKHARDRADAVRDELRQHELALRERELAVVHVIESVAERFRGLALPRVVGDFHMRPPPDDVLRGRIEELLRLIERMGPVNLDAVREHADAEQRLEHHTAQRADLEKALADLTRAIQQMNRESKRLFETTFQAVNARFQVVFPRMFCGGRAELRLTNPDDILESGIDIVAQPPGKKLSSIELMSGGEKALTAVSLVFAIFQIKPSPFCILDEVDAPLDEANVARYNDIVRSMTDRSQFILITHVKRTMQAVDVLYGVTMPEPGVSKIVSVKINEAADTRRTEARVA
jgi:chromosome segregation protein